jgi:hypothetical protein
MSVAIQFKRGTTTQHATFAGLVGEITVDTTKKTAVIHDGSTLGGTPLSKEGHTHLASDISGLKYQAVQIAGSNQPGQPTLNLSSIFTASNDVPNNRTTVDLANNNTSGAGAYGTATRSARLTINSQGLITSVSEVTITGVAPAGTASGDLTGNYPGPQVASVGGQTASNIAAAVNIANNATSAGTPSTLVLRDSSGNFTANVVTAALIGNVTGNVSGTAATITGNLTGDVTSVGMTTALTSVNSNVGQFGSATQVPKITVDAKGRISAVSLVTVSGVSPSGGAGGDLSGNYPSPNVATVGGSSAAAVATATTAVNNSTSTNTASTLVKRDGNGSTVLTGLQQTINVTSFSATPVFNLALGGIQQITLTGDVTSSTISGLAAGQTIIFDIIQGGAGNHAFVWPTNVYGTSTIGVMGGGHNVQAFYCDGSSLYALAGNRTDLNHT